MIVGRYRIAELDGEAVPDALAVGHAQRGLLPDLRALAATVFVGWAQRLDAELQRTFAAQLHLFLELDRTGALLEILAIVESACGREIRPVEAVGERLGPALGLCRPAEQNGRQPGPSDCISFHVCNVRIAG